MTRRNLFMVALLLAVVTFAPLAHADAASDARKAIQTAYDRENAAAARKDVNGMFANETSDFEDITKEGRKVNLTEMRAQLGRVMAGIQSIKATTTIQKFSLKGQQAIVVAKGHAEMTGVNPNNHSTVKAIIENTSEDLWVKTKRGWLQKRSKTLTESTHTTINGKPVGRGM